MPAIIFAHPRSPVQFDPPPSDPREQPVVADCGCVYHAEEGVPCEHDRALSDGYALPQPGVSEPIRAALDRNAPEDTCVCGVPTRFHSTMDLKTWLGCAAARVRQGGPKNPERWNDPYTPVTLAVRKAMVDGTCGPTFEIDMAHYTNDEQLTIAATVVRIAIAEYAKGGGK